MQFENVLSGLQTCSQQLRDAFFMVSKLWSDLIFSFFFLQDSKENATTNQLLLACLAGNSSLLKEL